jgi:CRP-like cAMP-binding protein
VATTANRLLGGLPPSEYERILPAIEIARVSSKERLHRQGETPERVYFPGRGLYSVVTVMQDGSSIEVGMIGASGTTGILALGQHDGMSLEVRVQIPSESMQAMSIDVFRDEMDRGGPFSERVVRYERAFFEAALQGSACHGLHGVDERCCRWLLSVHDMIGRADLPVTQDALAAALGVRRPTISITVMGLRRAGLIGQGHGRITILNRAGLEPLACECYGAIKRTFARLA